MLDFGYYNMDCMQGMKEFPDNYFDLAIVDPPYGDGGGYWSGTERFGGRFDRYRAPAFTGNSTPSPMGGIPNTSGGGTERTDTSQTDSAKASVSRTGGTWAAKFGKKSSRGTSRREKNISKNFSASHGIRLYGGAITSNCQQTAAF